MRSAAAAWSTKSKPSNPAARVRFPEDSEILIPAVSFGEVRRAQLAKSTLLTSSLVPLGSFQIF